MTSSHDGKLENMLRESYSLSTRAPEWRKVFHLGNRLAFKRGTVICMGGEKSDLLSFIEKGEVRLMRTLADGREKMGNLAVTKDRAEFRAHPFIGEGYSGTGDLFASVIAGGKARGDDLAEDMKLAGEMIELAIRDAVRDGVPRNEGAEYEKYLTMLMEHRFGAPSGSGEISREGHNTCPSLYISEFEV